MIELIKKAMFTGLGVASLTREKIEDISREFVEKGKLSELEGKKLVDELLEISEKSKSEIKNQVEEHVTAALSTMKIATGKEIDELKQEIIALKQAIEENKVEKE